MSITIINCKDTKLRINAYIDEQFILYNDDNEFYSQDSILRIHVMSGKVESPTTANDIVYEKNLLYAIEKCKSEDIVVVIEPINNYSVPNYYMNNFQKGKRLFINIITITFFL